MLTQERRGEIALALLKRHVRKDRRIPQDFRREIGEFLKDNPQLVEAEVLYLMQEVLQEVLNEAFSMGELAPEMPSRSGKGAFEFRA
ncbi:MAG: hypothetical protein A2571_01775 [Candidatus Vogelbacteria bacterium RIFOXYD1_FULL_44_32]|uniref:Uncharacterized protein n=1 Tax=Candidatus Vogelbacteria bacterium RIFOXYD1_FULL_44_32 TaxID=1802438 RepID=A0A1G2QDB6_9BACT|nr:MAG: hypothetical protein A2571_01775 [Candidatus Vogelbacteria bacterium RIFOXYD1_FULL_44_32]